MGPAFRALVLVATVVVILGSAGSARADRLATLVGTLEHSRSEKARLAAAVSLGRLSDPRATEALADALGDPSRAVRAVAATILGRLADPKALPALRNAARDPDPLVRQRAAQAIVKISRHKQYRQDAQRIVGFLLRRTRLTSYQIGAHERPLMTASTPSIFIIIASSTDKSPRARAADRRFREGALRRLFVTELSSSTPVTLDGERGQQLDLSPFSLDLSIARCARSRKGHYIEIGCTIGVAISDQDGRMLSVLSGGAKVRIPRSTFRRQYLHQLELRALEGAVKNVNGDLVDHLMSVRRASAP